MQIVSVRRVALGCLFIAATPIVRTAFAQPGPEPVIRLRFYDQAGIDPKVLEKAQQQLKRIFKRIGVNAEWEVDGEPQFRILIVEQMSPAIASRGVEFGRTPRDPDGTTGRMSYVAYGVIRAFVRTPEPGRRRLNEAELLAYSFAHEIGHLLLSPGSHSPTGIMRERWRESDFKLIATDRLLFTPDQEKHIKAKALLLAQQH